MSELASSLAGKTVVMTGATDGMGRVAARGIADAGARLCLIARDEAKAGAFAARCGPHARIEIFTGDLARLDDVARLAGEILSSAPAIDVLINNAGVMKRDFKLTADGFETTIAVNHLAVHALTLRLLPGLAAAPRARIVNVNSAGHRMTMRGGGGVSLEPATWRADPRYDTFMAYSRSKLANLLTSYELARRLRAARQQTTINALHPGLIRSRLGREMSPLLTLPFLLLFGASPERGARAILNLAVAPNLQGRSGLYFDELRETASSPYSYDQHQQARAWAESVAATGLDFSPARSPHR